MFAFFASTNTTAVLKELEVKSMETIQTIWIIQEHKFFISNSKVPVHFKVSLFQTHQNRVHAGIKTTQTHQCRQNHGHNQSQLKRELRHKNTWLNKHFSQKLTLYYLQSVWCHILQNLFCVCESWVNEWVYNNKRVS